MRAEKSRGAWLQDRRLRDGDVAQRDGAAGRVLVRQAHADEPLRPGDALVRDGVVVLDLQSREHVRAAHGGVLTFTCVCV